MVRVVMLMLAGILAAGATALGAELASAEHEVEITVEEAYELQLATPTVSVSGHPLEERTSTLEGELTFSANTMDFDYEGKVTVSADEDVWEPWLTLKVVPELQDSIGADTASEVVLIDEGIVAGETDLITGIDTTGSYSVDLTYIVEPTGWIVSADIPRGVTITYRLLEG